MKNGKLNSDPHRRNPTSTSISKGKDLKHLQLKPNSPPIQALNAIKDHPDSKTSTQDRSRKLDFSQTKVKDTSIAVSGGSLLQDEENAENNISAISIINMLGDGNLFSINQEPLNFDSIEDNEILKRELEMKNRLIEKLMKENANLREEMECFLTTMEQVKDNQGNQQRVIELERHVGQLESENRSLREQLVKNKEDWVVKEDKMHQFEKQIQHYSEYTKSNLEEFYLRLNQQMLSFVDTSRRQHDTFLRVVGGHVEDIREEALSSRSLTLSHSASVPGKTLEHTLNKKMAPKEASLSLSQPVKTPRSSEQGGRVGSSGKDVGKSRGLMGSFSKIDENPEFRFERRGSLATTKSQQSISTVKKMDNKENIPVNQKGGKLRDVAMTRSVVMGRGSMGVIGEKKR